MRVAIGFFLCLAGLILLQKNQTYLGMPAFVFGIILMYGGRWPRR